LYGGGSDDHAGRIRTDERRADAQRGSHAEPHSDAGAATHVTLLVWWNEETLARIAATFNQAD
jgi:hypothetical protein